MSDITINLEGMEELLQAIESLEDLKPIRGAVQAMALYMKGKVAVYPPYRHIPRKQIYGFSFFSDKQRKWFFAAVAEGRINVGHSSRGGKTSQGFGRRWTITPLNSGLTAIIGNNTSYGEFLMGAKRSKRSEAGGWRLVSEVLEDNRSAVQAYLRIAAKQLLSNLSAKAR